jgi:2-polyprenyl-3-methyl-5-hydroxy-6-metoxy-1,4-benzoquinol methylase
MVEKVPQSFGVCNVCGAKVTSLLVSKDDLDVYVCGSCRLAFTYPQPELLAEQYNNSYFDLYRRRRLFRLKRAEARLKQIELIMSPGRLLDIGCSLGYFVEAANARGWAASGVEISPYAAEEARDRGLDVRTGTIEDAAFPDASFDCVTMWDVLEHVPDPTVHMLEVRRILTDGGLVVIGTPDIGHLIFRLKRERWRHLKPAEHVFYFCRNSIFRLLEKTGFRLVRPPIIGGRSFEGSLGTRLRCMFSRFVQLNDVITVYGIKQ